jgi:hypothetical protein
VDFDGNSPGDRALARWEARAHAAVTSGRRQVVYQWSAPRSPALRLVVAPLLVLALLLVLVLGLLLFMALLTFAIATLIAVRLATLRRR